ncbi:MAG: cysteine desulfurase family protein [Pseudomonadota bacterium]
MPLDLDANASYQPSAKLAQLLSDAWTKFGNPSSLHRRGQRAKAAIEEARNEIRKVIGAGQSDYVIFTSGASEANNTVIASAARQKGSLISSTIEHPCVLRPLTQLSAGGHHVTLVAPNSSGEVAPQAVSQALTGEVSLVSIMAANNETGVVNDIRSLASETRKLAPKATIHTDAAQLLGKVPLSFNELGVDCMTISGHKIGALTGVGALIIRKGIELTPLILGGAQEHKLRGGTENVAGILSFGWVAKEVGTSIESRRAAMSAARDLLEKILMESISDLVINGAAAERLPNTSSIWIPGIRAEDLLVALDNEGIFVSSGAACSSGKPEPSHVLLAMGQGIDRARETIRVSFHAEQTTSDASLAAEKIVRIVRRIRDQRAIS